MKQGQEKIDVAYLVSRYPAISHTFILREVLGLRERGFRVRVASINPADRAPDQMAADEAAELGTVYCVKRRPLVEIAAALLEAAVTRPVVSLRGLWRSVSRQPGTPKARLYGVFYFLEALLVGRWMRREGIGHLHVHFANPAAFVALAVRDVFGANYSLTVHGPDEFYDVKNQALKEKMEGASFILCIGHYAESQVLLAAGEAARGKTVVCPLGVDLEKFAPAPKKSGDGVTEILCVGRLVPAKGQLVLLEAFKLLLRSERPALLRFVGDGPDRDALEAWVREEGLEERVVFEGAVHQDRIREFYRTADVFALMSFAEGIPVVLMEAMAMAIPCLSTRITGIPELIRDGRDGILVTPSDVQATFRALARLCDDPELRAAMGEEGRLRVREMYDLDKNIGKLAEILRARLSSGFAAV
jgi:glycosyltransferase involved in cell wall biosynthesis